MLGWWWWLLQRRARAWRDDAHDKLSAGVGEYVSFDPEVLSAVLNDALPFDRNGGAQGFVVSTYARAPHPPSGRSTRVRPDSVVGQAQQPRGWWGGARAGRGQGGEGGGSLMSAHDALLRSMH